MQSEDTREEGLNWMDVQSDAMRECSVTPRVKRASLGCMCTWGIYHPWSVQCNFFRSSSYSGPELALDCKVRSITWQKVGESGHVCPSFIEEVTSNLRTVLGLLIDLCLKDGLQYSTNGVEFSPQGLGLGL